MVTVVQAYISKKRELSCFFEIAKFLFFRCIVFFKTAFNSKFDSKRTCTTAISNCLFTPISENPRGFSFWFLPAYRQAGLQS